VVDHVAEGEHAGQPGRLERLVPPDGERPDAGHVGAHADEPVVACRGQPVAEPGLTDAEIPWQAPGRETTFGQRQPSAGREHPRQAVDGGLLVGEVVDDT
jgi:hypothetical protein